MSRVDHSMIPTCVFRDTTNNTFFSVAREVGLMLSYTERGTGKSSHWPYIFCLSFFSLAGLAQWMVRSPKHLFTIVVLWERASVQSRVGASFSPFFPTLLPFSYLSRALLGTYPVVTMHDVTHLRARLRVRSSDWSHQSEAFYPKLSNTTTLIFLQRGLI